MNLGHLKFELERVGGYGKFIVWGGMAVDLWIRYRIPLWLLPVAVVVLVVVASWVDRKFFRGGELEKGLKDNPEWRDKIK